MSLTDLNAQRWAVARIQSARKPEFVRVAQRLCGLKDRFVKVARVTNVPWYVIAVIKEREAGVDLNFNRSIAQGDPWNAVSVHVPKGRGPFKSWEEAAFDALVRCAPYASFNKDWSPGGTLTLLERYNGLAYANKGRPSPYVWSGTDQYVRGKVLVDHGPIEEVVDVQLGCAGLLLAMAEIDQSVADGMGIKNKAQIPIPPDAAPPKPAALPVKQSWLSILLSFFRK